MTNSSEILMEVNAVNAKLLSRRKEEADRQQRIENLRVSLRKIIQNQGISEKLDYNLNLNTSKKSVAFGSWTWLPTNEHEEVNYRVFVGKEFATNVRKGTTTQKPETIADDADPVVSIQVLQRNEKKPRVRDELYKATYVVCESGIAPRFDTTELRSLQDENVALPWIEQLVPLIQQALTTPGVET